MFRRHTVAEGSLYEVLTLGSISGLVPDHDVEEIGCVGVETNDRTLRGLTVDGDTLSPQLHLTTLTPETDL